MPSSMGVSQRRLYDQMLTLRTRLNERLAKTNRFAKFLEATLVSRDGDLKRANEQLVTAMIETETLLRLSREASEEALRAG